jgi:hypothetical protein
VVRAKDDGRAGRVVVVYVKGTPEDDYSASDSALSTAVAPYAARQQRFGASEAVALLEFLAGGEAAAEPETDESE